MGSIKQQRKALVEQRLPPPTRSTSLASSSITPGRTLLGCTGRTPMGDLPGPVAQFPGPGRSRTRRGPAGFCPGHRRPPMLPVALGSCLQSRPGPSRGMLPLAEAPGILRSPKSRSGPAVAAGTLLTKRHVPVTAKRALTKPQRPQWWLLKSGDHLKATCAPPMLSSDTTSLCKLN